MQQAPGQAEPALWRVTSIVDQLTFDPATGGGRVKRVNFRLFNGTSSYVDIPLSEFNADNVGQKVAEHAEELLQAMGVTGPPVSQTPYGAQ